MKIELHCRSLLLEKSLRSYLQGYELVEEGGDVVICDHLFTTSRPCLRIGTDEEAELIKPFTRSQLLLKLEALQKRYTMGALPREENLLEEKIEEATRRFVKEIVQIVKEYGARE